MNRTVLRALVTLTVAALVSVQSLVAAPKAFGTKSVLGGPTNSIGAAKNVQNVSQQLDGSYNVTYTVTVQNYGNGTLYNVQVTDDIANAFPLPSTFTSVGVPTATGTLTANPAFNGANITDLLIAGSSTLAVGAIETITFTVNVNVPAGPAVYYNSAVASGTDVNGNGFVSDSTNWGPTNPISSNVPTPTPLNASTLANIGIAKTILDTITQGCSIEIPYQIVIRNYSNSEGLKNINVIDDLSNTFPAPATFTVGPVTFGGPGGAGLSPAVNTYDGITNTALVDPATSTLGIGQIAYIFFNVTVDFAGTFGNFGNNASASAQGAVSNQPTSDNFSNNGTNPDPSGDFNPSEQSPTIFPVEGFNVGAAKSATAVLQPDGSYNVSYVVTVQNFGGNTATNLSVIDNLGLTFPAPVTFTIVNSPTVSQGTMVPSLTFGQGANWDLLGAGSYLSANTTGEIFFTINVQLNNTTDTLFLNSATVTASNSCGISVSDVSTNGTLPDNIIPYNNYPSDPGEDIPTPIVLLPTVTKIPGGFSPNGDGTNDFFVISNIGGKKVSVEIFNRWGAAVYKNDTYDNSWNGNSNTGIGIGDNLPTGTYWYVIKIDDTKEVKEYANYITLSR